MGKWFLELFTHTRLIFSVFSPAERCLMGGQGFYLFLDVEKVPGTQTTREAYK